MEGLRDLTTVKILNKGGGKALVISSAYLPYEAADPITTQLRDFADYGSRANTDLIIGCDANAHHVIWGSSDVNRRGEKVLEFLVGKLIQQAAGKVNLKRVTLELGGKSPLIIMNDADLNVAVPTAAFGVFAHQGQICVAASRLFVQSGIYDKFVEKAVEFAKNKKVGNPADAAVDQGPQIDGEMLDKVLGYIEKGKKEGAKLLTGGKRIGTTGFYVEPTVFADVNDSMTIAKEEIFGPVQSILKFDTLEEVIDRANNTSYGLAAGIFTTNLNNALQFAKHVEAGNVWVNGYLMGSPQTPFGGYKDSGLGRESGFNCVDPYLEVKSVTISLPKKF